MVVRVTRNDPQEKKKLLQARWKACALAESIFTFSFTHNMRYKRRGSIQSRQPTKKAESTIALNDDQEKETVLLAAEPTAKKWQNWWLRTTTTFLMIGGFFAVLASGHVWVILMVMAIQTIVYGEVVQIAQGPAKEKNMRWHKTISWWANWKSEL